MERLCLDCGSALKGRSDKKFCDDGCRSNYNNLLRARDRPLVKKINLILRKNQQILEKLNPGQKVRISSAKVLSSGLDLNYFTHQRKTNAGKLYHFCYDQGYVKLNDKAFLIVKRDEQY